MSDILKTKHKYTAVYTMPVTVKVFWFNFLDVSVSMNTVLL